MLRTTPWMMLLATLALPLALAAPPSPGHWNGQGHADLTWTHTAIPPSWDATGTGYLTTNLASFGESMVFQLPITSLTLKALPPGAPVPDPLTGDLTLNVPASTDAWWATYGGGVPGGITTGGTITFHLAGGVEHHSFATTIYGDFVVTGATGQYAGMSSHGTFSGSATGGPGSWGQLYDFAMVGTYS